MANSSSSLLKVHREERPEAARPELSGDAGFAQLCQAFTSATGWQVTCVPGAAVPTRAKPSRSRLAFELDMLTASGTGLLKFSPGKGPAKKRMPREQVQPFAVALADMLNDLQRTRVALWQREAELAAGVPLIPHAAEGERLAARLEATLRSGAAAINCQAAGLYMLDEGTSHLKLRASWHLPPERFLEEPRPLRGAVADLEALTGHAVAIEDAEFLPHWRVPEPHFPAAVCVPVSTPTTPLGTLWGFATSPRGFTERETGLWEIVAGRVAADLERELLLNDAVQMRSHERAMASVTQWQQDRRVQTAPLVDDYDFSAWSPPGTSPSASFYDWQVLRDGGVALATGCVHTPGAAAVLGSTQLLATLRAHTSHRHNAAELLGHVNDSLWHASPGDERSSLAYARIDPELGRFEAAAAGNVVAAIVRAGKLELLPTESTRLAAEPDLAAPLISHSLAAGETILLCAVAAEPKSGARGKAWSAKRLLQATAGERMSRPEQIVSVVRQKLDAIDAAATADAAIVAVKRRA